MKLFKSIKIFINRDKYLDNAYNFIYNNEALIRHLNNKIKIVMGKHYGLSEIKSGFKYIDDEIIYTFDIIDVKTKVIRKTINLNSDLVENYVKYDKKNIINLFDNFIMPYLEAFNISINDFTPTTLNEIFKKYSLTNDIYKEWGLVIFLNVLLHQYSPLSYTYRVILLEEIILNKIVTNTSTQSLYQSNPQYTKLVMRDIEKLEPMLKSGDYISEVLSQLNHNIINEILSLTLDTNDKINIGGTEFELFGFDK